MENKLQYSADSAVSFFDQPQVETGIVPVGPGVKVGFERVFHPGIGIGGCYGTWGDCYDNQALMALIERYFGKPLSPKEQMDLASLGFVCRHHVPELNHTENLELEVEFGARLLREAAQACGWKPEEVSGVLIGMSAPISDDYTERIAERAGIPSNAFKMSIHKACDSSMGALHLLMNPEQDLHQRMQWNIARELYGKKVLVGGIEGLSRYIMKSRDKNAMQLFGNGAGVIGVVPGQSMTFLAGQSSEVYDEKGLLAVSMYYPHSRRRQLDQSMIEVSQAGKNHIRVAGMMHEPEGGEPVVMAGPMGMVKLFVRSGVQAVAEALNRYQALMDEVRNVTGIKVGIVHHANLKINQLKAKRLSNMGINIPMPWVLSEFGNISAASNRVAFLRQLTNIQPGEHVLFDGFGAGTYYDAFTVAMGEKT
jgi:3-oxoacyl-[acyl-carrier-protein] synthase III